MPSRRSLAELTLDWCAGEVSPEGSVRPPSDEKELLTSASRDAMRAGGVALLQAGAAEFDSQDLASLGSIASLLENDEAMMSLEEKITASSAVTTTPRERAALVGQEFRAWMSAHLGNELRPKMKAWLERGWPDVRARGGMMTFYQAFCGALQRAMRQDQAAWDAFMQNTAINAATWRQWLIREADPGTLAPAPARGKKAAKAFAMIVLIAALAGAGAWYWWKEIETRISKMRAAEQSAAENAKAVPPSPDRPESPATPEPKAAQQAPPKTEQPPSAVPTEEPRVNVRPDGLVEAGRLMAEAERTLLSAKPEAGDRAARSALDILSIRLPSNDPRLAESLLRAGQYWERREDWAEAARIYQQAVKAYEKTPAENTNPQLQAVSRWASALRHTGRNTEAERLYRTLLQAYDGMGAELRPEMATVAHNLGNVLYATDRLRDAREAYALALKLMAERQSDPAAQALLSRFKGSYAECLRKLGISQPQIDADLRNTLNPRPPSKVPSFR